MNSLVSGSNASNPQPMRPCVEKDEINKIPRLVGKHDVKCTKYFERLHPFKKSTEPLLEIKSLKQTSIFKEHVRT